MTMVCPKCQDHLATGAAPPPVMVCGKCGEHVPVVAGARLAPKKLNGCLLVAIVGFASIPILGILAAIAIPSFIKFQPHSKQVECKATLRTLYDAERAYFQDHDTYTTKLSELDDRIDPGNRYTYFLGTGPVQDGGATTAGYDPNAEGIGPDPRRRPTTAAVPVEAITPWVRPGIRGKCPNCTITLACAGNIDNDEKLDVWSISTEERTINGMRILAGEPFNDVRGH